MARDKPDTPADRVVAHDEIVILYVRLIAYGIHRARSPPEKPPDIRTFVIDIAKLAGFHPRKSQLLPGTALLWKGICLPARRHSHIPGLEGTRHDQALNRLNCGVL